VGRPRNNIMKLTADTRLRICELLDDGATYDDIRDDELVAAECAKKDLALHNRSFLAYRTGVEFEEYCMRRHEWSDDMQKNKIAAALVESCDGSDDIARLASYKLLRICQTKLDGGENLTDKELRAVSGAISSYNRNRIAQEKEDTKRAFEAEKAEYQAKIAQLSATIQRQTEQLNGNKKTGLSNKALEEIEQAAGLL